MKRLLFGLIAYVLSHAATSAEEDYSSDNSIIILAYLHNQQLATKDTDNDGVIDANDAFPRDASETSDVDLDGIGDNADLDDDNDGVADTHDLYPLDPYHYQDINRDGSPDPVAKIASLTSNVTAGRIAEFSSKYATDKLTHQWSLSTPSKSFANLTSSIASSVAFEPDINEPFTLKLTVSDGKGISVSDQVVVTPKLPSPKPLPYFAPTAPPAPNTQDMQDAVRLLYQATTGIKVEDVDYFMDVGAENWFNEQLTMPPNSYIAAWDAIAEEFGDNDGRDGTELIHESFMYNALFKPDQLRQRMTYALSQLFVISARFDYGHYDRIQLNFVDTLQKHAFGNFRHLMEDVTLNTAMGMFLAMLGNQKADEARNIRPDENYAREIMQLFTIGLAEMNQDGSYKLSSSGEQIQTYTQKDVQNYAAALTGWYFADLESYRFGNTFHSVDFPLRLPPMGSYDEYHQKTQKKLLRDYYVPAGATAEESLKAVLDSLFYHPNLAPFIAKHLIKNFVTSNPSKDYVARVSAVFNANEDGERGNLASVIQAVLFDPDARSKATLSDPTFGRVKDPLLKFINYRRFLNVASYQGNRWHLRESNSMKFLHAPSVFNFYSPSHIPSKDFANLELVSPELQIITSESIVGDSGPFAYPQTKSTFDAWSSDAPESDRKYWTVYDFDALTEMFVNEGLDAVIEHLNIYLAQGLMSEEYKQALRDRFADDESYFVDQYKQDPSIYTEGNLHNVLGGLVYIVTLTPEFSVQH